MHMLSQRKSLQRGLRENLPRSTAFDSAPFTQRDTNALLLFDASLIETLRLYSANPGPWPRRVPATGCQAGRLGAGPAYVLGDTLLFRVCLVMVGYGA